MAKKVNPHTPQERLIVFTLYPDFDILDVAGPYAMLHSVPNTRIILAADQKGPVKSWQGPEWVAEYAYKDIKEAYMTFTPGGYGPHMNGLIAGTEGGTVGFLKRMGPGLSLITSVCTGALVVASAGLLNGFQCTTHWDYRSDLSLFPGVILAPDYPRYVMDRNRVTGGGVSSGLDLGLALAAILSDSPTAQSIQLSNQYMPDPPFTTGDPAHSPPDLLFQAMNGDPAGNAATLAAVQKRISTL